MRYRPRSIALLAALAALGVAATPAHAENRVICVGQTGPAITPCDLGVSDVQAALDRARTTPGFDTVRIAAGTHEAPSATGFRYSDDGVNANTVRIEGAGQSQTRLTRASKGPVLDILTKKRSDVFDLAVSPASGTAPTDRSFGIRGQGNQLVERVTVDGPPATRFVTGVDLQGGIRLADITLPTESDKGNIAAAVVSAGATEGENVVDRSKLTAFVGLSMPDRPVLVRRTRIDAGFGITKAGGGSFTVESTAIRLLGTAGGRVGILAQTLGGFSDTMTLRHVTIFGPGGPGTTGVQPTAFSADATLPASLVVNVDSSIVRGVDKAFVPVRQQQGTGNAQVTVNATRSNFDKSPASAPISNPGETSNIDQDPRFADAANGDLHLVGGSPSIDTGRQDVATAEHPLDLDSNPRLAGPATDMGAHEYQRRAPAVTAATTTPTTTTGRPASFTATATDPDPGEVPTLRWSFDDGATTTGTTGATATHAFATPGRHTATVTATDPVGLTATTTVTVTVTAAQAGTGDATPAQPNTASITKLSLFPTAFLTSGKNAGTLVSFTLSRAATARFTVERLTKGRSVKGKCVASSTRNRKAKPCTKATKLTGALDRPGKAGLNTFRFTGKLAGKTLAPGNYRLVATSGRSTQSKAFTVKRAPRKRKP